MTQCPSYRQVTGTIVFLPLASATFLGTHEEFQQSAALNVLVVDIPFVVWLPVQAYLADVAVLVADVMGDDAEGAPLHPDLCFREERCPEDIAPAGRFNLIEAEGREDIPG